MARLDIDTKMLNLTPDERQFIKYYRLLDEQGKALVDNLVKKERDRSIKELEDKASPKTIKSTLRKRDK